MIKSIVSIIAAAFIFSICTVKAHAVKIVTPPITRNAIVLDSDRAVLLADYPANKGTKIRLKGFLFGTSPSELAMKIASRPVERGCMNVLVTGLKPENIYYFQPYISTSKQIYYGEVLSFTTSAMIEWTSDKITLHTSEERYNLIFGVTNKYYRVSDPPWGYHGGSEAKKHLVKITVNTWSFSKGKKVSKTRSFLIHYKLANNIKAIFDEIYALDIQFPIISLSSYSYRRMVIPWVKNNPYLSQHSFGTCIDINKKYNLFYRSKDKRNKNSPYHIPESVINIFKKYGWSWGGEFAEGLDTMHFQYLGPELTVLKP